jgi:GT2 family glycosyltransferase
LPPADGADPVASVIVLAYGDEPYLGECIAAALATTGPEVEIVVVDNGASAAVERLPRDARVRIERAAENLGYAGGCNLGAQLARGAVLAFLNSDAIMLPGALDALRDALDDHSVGLVSGDVRLASAPESMNTAGNPVHYLGVVWAGSLGEPATLHERQVEVATASGAFLGVRREVWRALGGFDEVYFAYHEDTELSLRCWQSGLRVVFVPGATVRHYYEFSRNANKQYLVERNRWLTVLTVYPTAVLRAVVPAMVGFELALSAVAILQGWFPAKVRGWIWLVRNRRIIADRRAQVQAADRAGAVEFAARLASAIEPAVLERPPMLGVLNRLLRAYWAVARRTIR